MNCDDENHNIHIKVYKKLCKKNEKRKKKLNLWTGLFETCKKQKHKQKKENKEMKNKIKIMNYLWKIEALWTLFLNFWILFFWIMQVFLLD